MDPKGGPFILTIQLDEKSAAFFEELRQRNYPSDINRVGAHLTLFHQLPADREKEVLKAVGAAALSSPPFLMRVTSPLKLGRGVALRLESRRLERIRERLAADFRPWLIGQDRERFEPHVTVMNKVSPAMAQGFFDSLAATFAPFEAMAEAIQIWRYERGPWSPVAAIAFQGAAGALDPS